jgi:predicted cupin superfamily sugar epimerase
LKSKAPVGGRDAQVLVPTGVWQRTVPARHDALVSCLVSPGFDFDDFELAHGDDNHGDDNHGDDNHGDRGDDAGGRP